MEATDFALLPRNYGQYDVPSEDTLDKWLNFTDRQTYIEWRADWKENYKELSQNIRELRKAWRAEGSDHDFKQHRDLFAARARARSMLALRKASKVKAERLYQESKATAEVA